MRDSLLQPMRVISILMLAMLTILTLVDIAIYPDKLFPLLIANLIAIGVILVFWRGLDTLWKQNRSEMVGLLISTVVLASALYKTLLIQESFIPLAAIMPIVASMMIPWRMRYQVILVIEFIIAFFANVIILNESVASPLSLATSAGIGYSLFSLLLLHYSNERRYSLWQARTALQEERERFRQLGEHSQDIIWIWSPDGTVEYISPAYEQFTGRSPEKLYEDPLLVLKVVHRDDRAAFGAALEDIMRGEHRKIDLRVNHLDGSVYHLDGWGAPVRNEKGKVVRCIGIWRDVTERVQLAKEATETRYAAEAANRAKSIFLANMSHELRTPLNAILGYSQLMARDPHVTLMQQEYLETIAHSGEHLLGLINDVLTMSKIEAGRAALQENGFDLHRQLRGLQKMFQMRAADKELALRLDIEPGVPRYIYADEGKLRQVLMNLLSNAIKFTQEGSVTLRVGCPRQPAATADTPLDASAPFTLSIEVDETGAGIAPEEMDALFDPFVQTASGQQSQEGTGLGLPISRQFVNLMGGELGANSIVGQGTTFRVQIPVTIADADTVKVLESRPQRRVTGIEGGQTAADGGPFRLLVVEDNATNRDLLIKLLTPFGFDVRYAVNGAKGVEMWEAWQPHLVWMDIRMPVMDGYEATRQIKVGAAATGCQVIVIALTASAFDQDHKAILAAGCDDFVRKPFRESKIFDVLHSHLGVHFIYETVTPAPETAASVSPEDLRAAVEGMPAGWAADLFQATVALEADQMLALIEAIRPQAPHLANTIAQWVRAFEYEKLLALVGPEA